MRVRVLVCVLVLLPSLTTGAEPASEGQTPTSTRSPHGALKTACQNCHTFTSWKPIRSLPDFDHSKTKFPLRGLHEKVACRSCHVNMVFTNVSSKCADCHADIHRGQLGASCDQCHTVKGWRVSLDAINKHQNRFPLLGAHAVTECASCHPNAATGQFRGLSTDCSSCHFDAFRAAKLPDHLAAKFPTTCATCHMVDSWFGAKFNHQAVTGFALTAGHAGLACATCHHGGRYTGTSANCFSCHAKDFNATKNPNHVAAGFPQNCSTCHTTATWQGVRFDHNTFTQFPLTGAHASASCTQCHANGQFAGTPKTCSSCHLSDYQKTTNPNHVAAGFPQDCSICHSTVQWLGARFDHSRTRFPLTGFHTTLQCASCHAGGVFTGLNPTCVSCHLTNYNRTTNPNHLAARFPTDCQVCHSTSAWTPAAFNHSLTAFTLTGKHMQTPCASCHINGRYAGTPKDCYSCHQTVYQATTNPNHIAARFPTDCSQCHTTSQWPGARFVHDPWFPIYSGKHSGKWNSCADCHTNPSNFQVFSCLQCHEHARTKMDDKHKNIPNYVYNSANCYSCHPQGRKP